MMTREQCPTHAKPNRRRDRAADAWGRPEAGGGAAGGIAAPNAQVRHSGASAWHNWSNPGPATLAHVVWHTGLMTGGFILRCSTRSQVALRSEPSFGSMTT